jgi:hypothetical protein
MNDGFGITASTVMMPFTFQLDAQLLMVVDLAVENDPDVGSFVADRLMSRLNIYDAQTPHGQSHILVQKETVVIRSTVCDPPIHPRQCVQVHPAPAIRQKKSADPTHSSVLFFMK